MPLMGITRLANITGLDCTGIPVYLAIRPNSRSLSTSQGKGLDTDSAKASALMESIEAWHAERIEHPLRYESYLELRRHAPVVDISRLPTSASHPPHPNAPLLWLEGYDLLKQEPTWVPFESVTFNMVAFAQAHHPPGFLRSNNGLASGNHLLEALVHGLCEVIERDAEALFLQDRWELRKKRQLDLATVDDVCCREFLQRMERARMTVAAWDITSDLGIPSYSAMIVDSEESSQWRAIGTAGGSGSHLDPSIALLRALTEAAQSRTSRIAGSRDDTPLEDYALKGNADDQRLLRQALASPPPTWDFTRSASLATESFEGDLEVLLQALARAGIDSAVAVDLSKPKLGIPVVKVVVPGLEVQLDAVDQPIKPGARLQARRRSA
jgi:ribosomal protein S12 methylthiotransferase accessory factor